MSTNDMRKIMEAIDWNTWEKSKTGILFDTKNAAYVAKQVLKSHDFNFTAQTDKEDPYVLLVFDDKSSQKNAVKILLKTDIAGKMQW